MGTVSKRIGRTPLGHTGCQQAFHCPGVPLAGRHVCEHSVRCYLVYEIERPEKANTIRFCSLAHHPHSIVLSYQKGRAPIAKRSVVSGLLEHLGVVGGPLGRCP